MIRSFIRSIVPLFTEGNRPAPAITVPLLSETPTLPPAPMVTLSAPLPVAEQALTVEDVCRAMYADGYSIREVARELGLSYYMARKHVSAK